MAKMGRPLGSKNKPKRKYTRRTYTRRATSLEVSLIPTALLAVLWFAVKREVTVQRVVSLLIRKGLQRV